jgi:hypothetical protein
MNQPARKRIHGRRNTFRPMSIMNYLIVITPYLTSDECSEYYLTAFSLSIYPNMKVML